MLAVGVGVVGGVYVVGCCVPGFGDDYRGSVR